MKSDTCTFQRGTRARSARRPAPPVGAPPLSPEQERLIAAWFAGRIPDGWFEGPVTIEVDADEVQVVGTLRFPQLPEGASADEVQVAELRPHQRFREETSRSPDAHRRRGPAGLRAHGVLGRPVRRLTGALHHGRACRS